MLVFGMMLVHASACMSHVSRRGVMLAASSIAVPCQFARAEVTPLRPIEAVVKAGTLGPMALYPDPVLRVAASPVEAFGPSLTRFGAIMVEEMTSSAITAIQYGVDARIIALRGESSPDSKPLVLVNPRVLARSAEESMLAWREICLVLPPGLEVELLRDREVEVEAEDTDGRTFRKKMRGEPARAFQHELDHLNGILIIDHAALEDLPDDIRRREQSDHESRQRRAYRRPIESSRLPDPVTGKRALRPADKRSRFAIDADLATL